MKSFLGTYIILLTKIHVWVINTSTCTKNQKVNVNTC